MFSVRASLWPLFSAILSSVAGSSPFHQRRATPENIIVNSADNYCPTAWFSQEINIPMSATGDAEPARDAALLAIRGDERRCLFDSLVHTVNDW
ncbi:hypothetical protein D9619_010239 [Psilocybe cf. subviscida]|uniref:Uncharacterized protein n=1 Tax=Psilocybe cf. subviscida TaxID=2480587 RepID=A0A8H5ASG2_9AGAR|nr:hypothetical protein D9619_010239 [Psilocybe cf. subviscida]